MELGNKRVQRAGICKLFSHLTRPRIWGLGSTVGLLQGVSPDHTHSASQPRGSSNNRGSHEWSHRSFLKEALTGTPQGPEETRGSSGSSSEKQDVQLVTCGQGVRDSCV